MAEPCLLSVLLAAGEGHRCVGIVWMTTTRARPGEARRVEQVLWYTGSREPVYAGVRVRGGFAGLAVE